MSTPATFKFQISVPTTNDSGEAAAKVYNLTLGLLVESERQEDGEIQVTLLSSEPIPGIEPGPVFFTPAGDVPPPQDPPLKLN